VGFRANLLSKDDARNDIKLESGYQLRSGLSCLSSLDPWVIGLARDTTEVEANSSFSPR
jgi:hypothetical protein